MAASQMAPFLDLQGRVHTYRWLIIPAFGHAYCSEFYSDAYQPVSAVQVLLFSWKLLCTSGASSRDLPPAFMRLRHASIDAAASGGSSGRGAAALLSPHAPEPRAQTGPAVGRDVGSWQTLPLICISLNYTSWRFSNTLIIDFYTEDLIPQSRC